MRKVDDIYRRVGGEKRVRKCGKRGRSLRCRVVAASGSQSEHRMR